MKFLALYFFNLLLDYPLQDEFTKQNKHKYNYVLFVHSAIWGLGLCFVLQHLSMLKTWHIPMLVCGHFVIDYWKCHRLYKFSDKTALYIDQVLHVFQIILCFL